ncbi:MAG TPA: malto-oligosyltrehalose trehalohydrolase [Gemmatimonadaceae bacterium]|nr:malto-oligosyltrehalose trehalohydrolase [Gemmatimonadaceae bacterium]
MTEYDASAAGVAPARQAARGATAGERWALDRGATVLRGGGVRFAIWAPNAEAPSVRVFTNDGAYADHPLRRGDDGVWSGTVADAAAGTRYRYVVGGKDVPDPVSRWQPEGVHGPSVVVDPGAFRWTDGAWKGIEMADHVIYELHVGTFTAAGTFDAAIERLPALRELGVTSIEIMPVAEFPGTRNWGYDGVALYAPQSSYGGPEGLRRLVDAAHREGIAVVLDVVYNHVGPEGNYLDAFGPYFTEAYKTPWGRAVNYDGPDSPEVRRFVIDNALHWVTEYHVDALRLDAVHGIFDFGARHVLAEMGAAVREQARRLGRRVQLIGESDLNDPRVVRGPERGGWGLDAQWSDDFHHAVHALLAGESGGYYADFTGGVPMLAKAIAERFIYDGRYAPHRRRFHGAPASDVSAEHFVICLQNHDQVGNRALGERLTTLAEGDRPALAAALLLLSPYVPLLFMGEEYGETRPFQYFVSHTDRELLDAVRKGRQEEFKAFAWGEDVPDPGAEETFAGSKLDWAARERPGHRERLALYRELLQLRRAEPALRPGAARARVRHDDGAIAVELAADGGATLLALFNCSDAPRGVPAGGGAAARWRRLLATDEPRFGGRGPAAPEAATSDEIARLTLAPFSAALFRQDEG